MPTLEINGRDVEVDDAFLSLSPEQQQRTVEEIAQSLSPVGKRDPGHNAPEFIPIGVEGYDPATGEVSKSSFMDKAGAFITGANDVPVLGPAMKAGSAAAAAGLATALPREGDEEGSFGERYRVMRGQQERWMADNPGTALAGNVAGSALLLGGAGASPTAARALGISGPSLAGRVAASGASGSAIAGADAAVRGGSGADIATSAALGGGLGLALPVVGAGLRGGYQAAAGRLGTAFGGVRDPAAEAGRRVGRAAMLDTRAGAKLDADDVMAAQRNGQPLMNADLFGENTRALARTAANMSPTARGTMERAVGDRFTDQGNRVVRMVGRLAGGRTDDLALLDGLRSAASAANKPAYQRAFSKPAALDMWNSDLAQLMTAPAMQSAAKAATTRGANRAAAEGFKPVKNPFMEVNGKMRLRVGQDGRVARPTLQFWDQVKRNLDGDIGIAERAGDRTLAADLKSLRGKLVAALDSAVPEYRAARQGAAAFFGAEDAVEAGRSFAKSSRSLPEFKRGLAAMKPAEREAFETGFASELIDQAKSAGDKANVIKRMFGSQEAREKMVMAFGENRAREIEAFVRVENAMDSLRGAFGNSTTARQLIEAGVIGGGAWGYTGDFESGIAAAAATHGARYASKRINSAVMEKVAEMLLSNDPKVIARAVQNAAFSPQHMAAVDALTRAAAVASRSGALVGATEGARNLR